MHINGIFDSESIVFKGNNIQKNKIANNVNATEPNNSVDDKKTLKKAAVIAGSIVGLATLTYLAYRGHLKFKVNKETSIGKDPVSDIPVKKEPEVKAPVNESKVEKTQSDGLKADTQDKNHIPEEDVSDIRPLDNPDEIRVIEERIDFRTKHKITMKNGKIIEEEISDGDSVRKIYYDNGSFMKTKEVTMTELPTKYSDYNKIYTETLYDEKGNVTKEIVFSYKESKSGKNFALLRESDNVKLLTNLPDSKHLDIQKILELNDKYGKMSYDELVELYIKDFHNPKEFSEIEKSVLITNLDSKYKDIAASSHIASGGSVSLDALNDAIRGGFVKFEGKDLDEALKQWDTLFARIPETSVDTVRFRGEHYNVDSKQYKKILDLKPGDIYSSECYLWLTNRLGMAYSYKTADDKSRSILHVVKIPKGSKKVEEHIASTSGGFLSTEMTTGRNPQLKVLRKEVNENGDIIIFSEYSAAP